MRTTLLLVALTLTACVSSRLNNALNGLIGHDVHEMTQYLGYPSSQRESMGETIYVWSTSREGVLPVIHTSNTTGNVGGTPYSESTQSTAYESFTMQCTIQVAASKYGIIQSAQWEGNEAGCSRYARAFPTH